MHRGERYCLIVCARILGVEAFQPCDHGFVGDVWCDVVFKLKNVEYNFDCVKTLQLLKGNVGCAVTIAQLTRTCIIKCKDRI